MAEPTKLHGEALPLANLIERPHNSKKSETLSLVNPLLRGRLDAIILHPQTPLDDKLDLTLKDNNRPHPAPTPLSLAANSKISPDSGQQQTESAFDTKRDQEEIEEGVYSEGV
jgi:hypothetical protein